MINAETIRRAFVTGLDEGASIRMRRPALMQLELPAFRGDGDAGEIYIRQGSKAGQLVVTDLGTTRMRAGYTMKVGPELDEQLGFLAAGQGMEFADGEIRVVVGEDEMLAATLGLLQVEAQAERLSFGRPPRSRASSAFREQVTSLLRELFGEKVREQYHDEAHDPDGLYSIDALIPGPHPLAVAVVPNDLEAERAVGTKASLQEHLDPSTRWIAIPRDSERLASRTRKRLVKAYIQAGSSFDEDRGIVQGLLRDLAA